MRVVFRPFICLEPAPHTGTDQIFLLNYTAGLLDFISPRPEQRAFQMLIVSHLKQKTLENSKLY